MRSGHARNFPSGQLLPSPAQRQVCRIPGTGTEVGHRPSSSTSDGFNQSIAYGRADYDGYVCFRFPHNLRSPNAPIGPSEFCPRPHPSRPSLAMQPAQRPNKHQTNKLGVALFVRSDQRVVIKSASPRASADSCSGSNPNPRRSVTWLRLLPA
jgi:hypothetical protein